MRRMPPCVVVSSPPDDLRCYIYEGGKDSLDVYYSSLSINYRRDTSILQLNLAQSSKLYRVREMVGAAGDHGCETLAKHILYLPSLCLCL